MELLDHESLTFIVRWVHVVSMAVILGGVGLVWSMAPKSRSETPITFAVFLRAAEKYEWLFWGAFGLIVMTGVGNLGAFGNAVPDPYSSWGRIFSIKISIVFAFILVSVVRGLVAAGLSASDAGALNPRGCRLLSGLYGVTLLLVAAILLAAEELSHG
ncbi:MAG: hypothetical protein ACREJQ_03840 [bacterium]